MTKRSTRNCERLDVKEIAALLESAGVAIFHASETFIGMRSLFEAIKESSEPGSLAARLAILGESLCDSEEMWFGDQQATFDGHAERFSTVASTHDGSPA
ncbi:hypothetical protein [Burkholderia seminalis]|uniref:Uncharacterized protein n=2 Tax=Burkholderia cepacia complex TaxID=87882 RepID=A0A8A8D4D8_9BURK|nr:hypothetical protein [Burkholderia seminalis]QTO19595.1 hypothetical protein DT99_004955 [Burkholderia seminalis]